MHSRKLPNGSPLNEIPRSNHFAFSLSTSWVVFFNQRASDAFFAISLRLSAVSERARLRAISAMYSLITFFTLPTPRI